MCFFLLFFLVNNLNLEIIKKIKLPQLPVVDKVIYDGKNNLFVLSGEISILLKIDTTGKILDTIIRGKGSEIGKGKFLADMVYDEKDEHLFVSDFIMMRVSEFNKNGRFINSFLIDELFGNIGICGDTIFLRFLREIKEIDSLNYEAFLLRKINRKTGDFLGDVAKVIVDRKINQFFSMPFGIDCKKKKIYMIIPPDKIEIRNLKGEIIDKVTKREWIFITNLFLIQKYLVISAFSEDKRCYIVKDVIDSWKNISLNESIREEIFKRNLFKVKKEPPQSYEEISYVVDIFDIERGKFLLENYLSPGKLVGGGDNKIFFIKNDTLLIFELK